ncbi:MAG: tyrosine--tRNA ligase, partial [Gemmatimonadota bacterium]|nr:tyrosine--tRNA ligase [Gemmatimonadota bacterium]
GMELIRRSDGGDAHALTLPLVTTASGTKFGKTEAGAVWLDASLTSSYKFYQFWINADDRDVGRYQRFFTLLPRTEIEAWDKEVAEQPERREAQRVLAKEVTTRVHGAAAARVCEEMSDLLFGGADARTLSEAALVALGSEIPFVEVVATTDGALDALDLFIAARLIASKGAGRRLLEQGGLYANGARLASSDRTIPLDSLLEGGHLLLRKGTREYCLVAVRRG